MIEWQPIETAPEDKAIDVWVKSTENELFGRRATDVCLVGGMWYGKRIPLAIYGEYATHWMPLPPPPETGK